MPHAASLAEFFDRDGAVELLCLINPAGSGFEELVEQMPVSRNTVNERLKEAKRLGLITKGILSEDDPVVGLWIPTERGMELRYELEARSMPELVDEFLTVKSRLERERDAFEEYVRRQDDGYWERFDEVVEDDRGADSSG